MDYGYGEGCAPGMETVDGSGRYFFYEGDDPERFIKTMIDTLGINPRESPYWIDQGRFTVPYDKLGQFLRDFYRGDWPIGS